MKRSDKIFTAIMLIAVIGFGFWMGGASGVVNTIIAFLQQTFIIFVCIFTLMLLCVFFPKIRNFFDKSNKN